MSDAKSIECIHYENVYNFMKLMLEKSTFPDQDKVRLLKGFLKFKEDSILHLENCLIELGEKVRSVEKGGGGVLQKMGSLWNGPAEEYVYLIQGGRTWKYMNEADFPKHNIANAPSDLKKWWRHPSCSARTIQVKPLVVDNDNSSHFEHLLYTFFTEKRM